MFSIVLLGSCGVEGCTDPQAINYIQDATKDDGSCVIINIGDTYQGGIVFYLDGNGGGIVSAPTDFDTVYFWGCSGSEILGADGITIGTGYQNTIDIEADCSTPETAADICANSSIEGFSDWYLPSEDELNLMYENIGPGNNLGLGNIGNFRTDSYWTSSEADSTMAHQQGFWNGPHYTQTKFSYTYVRAVRSF